jgi:hypothetical protein
MMGWLTTRTISTELKETERVWRNVRGAGLKKSRIIGASAPRCCFHSKWDLGISGTYKLSNTINMVFFITLLAAREGKTNEVSI